MSWTGSNPVVIGYATKKAHYDALWDNADFLKTWLGQYAVNVKSDGGATGNGSTDDTSAIQTVLTNATAGDMIFFPTGVYKISDSLTINKSLRLVGLGYGSEIKQITSNKRALLISSSDVALDNLYLYGPQYAVTQTSENAIEAYGASAASYISNLRITNCKIENWGQHGILGDFVEKFWILNNEIKDVYYAGILVCSGSYGWIQQNRVKNVVGTPDGYGISVTRHNGSLATYPRSTDVHVESNKVYDVLYWTGYDTHAGNYIKFTNNFASNCYLGIGAVSGTDGAGETTISPNYVKIENNDLFSEKGEANASYGIILTGSFYGGAWKAYNYGSSIVGNRVHGYGTQTNTDGMAGIYAYCIHDARIDGNTVYFCKPNGITLWRYCDLCTINSNIIDSPYTTYASPGVARGINIHSTYNYRNIIDSNIIVDTGGSYAHRLDNDGVGIYVHQDPTNSGYIGMRNTNAYDEISDTAGYYKALTLPA